MFHFSLPLDVAFDTYTFQVPMRLMFRDFEFSFFTIVAWLVISNSMINSIYSYLNEFVVHLTFSWIKCIDTLSLHNKFLLVPSILIIVCSNKFRRLFLYVKYAVGTSI